MNKFNSIYYSLELVLSFFILSTLCYSQTTVGGDINSTTTWYSSDSPYNITEDITIREGATLTIENGVTVNCQNRYLFVGLYKSGEIVADSVVFNNGTIEFRKESTGSILNSDFNKTRLYLEDYSSPSIKQNIFDKDSPIFIHSPDVFPNFQNNSFTNGDIIFSFDIEYDLNLAFIENCTYHMDNDIYIGNDAILSIDKLATLNLWNNSIYVGNYSDAQLNASEVNLYYGRIIFSDNSIGQIINSNISRTRFELIDSAELTISNSNLDSTITITNNSSLTVEATNNYWGRPEGPIMNDSVAVLIGDVNYLPFSSVPLNTTTGIIENKTINNGYKLLQNYPNPFNPVTVISYKLPVVSEIELSIYNLLGQKVATLVSEKQKAGNYKLEWDASRFTSGAYFYRLKTDKGFDQSRKPILIK